GMGPPGAVLKAKSLYIISQFGKGSSSRCTCKSSSYNNHIVFSFIGRVDQFHIEFMLGPFFGYRSRWNFRFKYHIGIFINSRSRGKSAWLQKVPEPQLKKSDRGS